MPPRRRAFKVPFTVLVTLGLTSLGGCTYEQEGPPEAHFEKFDAKPPKLDTVSVCHAYGRKEQTPFAFSQADIAEISAVMARVPRNDSPSEERRAIAYSIAWPHALDPLGCGDQRDRQRRAFCHRFICGRQWREPDSAGGRELLCARQLRATR